MSLCECSHRPSLHTYAPMRLTQAPSYYIHKIRRGKTLWITPHMSDLWVYTQIPPFGVTKPETRAYHMLSSTLLDTQIPPFARYAAGNSYISYAFKYAARHANPAFRRDLRRHSFVFWSTKSTHTYILANSVIFVKFFLAFFCLVYSFLTVNSHTRYYILSYGFLPA